MSDTPHQDTSASRVSSPGSHSKRLGWLLASLAALTALGMGSWIVWTALPSGEDLGKTSVNIPEGVGFTQKLDASIPGDVSFVDEQGRDSTIG